MNEYEGVFRVQYGESGATFVPVCKKCGRFVKADDKIILNGIDGPVEKPNATCKKDGRVEMIFEGFLGFGEDVRG